MALNGEFGLGIVFDFTNRGMQHIINTEKAFGRMYTNVNKKAIDIGASLEKMGVAFASISAAAAPLLGFKALADAAGEFETGLVKIKNVSGATAAEMTNLRKASIDASLSTRFSPTEANAGLESLASLGFTAKQSIDLLIPTLDFAAANNLEVGKAADITGAAMKIYGIQIDDVGFALDRLSKIANLTALGGGDLQEALATSAKGAIAAKQGMTELLIAMGLAKNAGLDTSVTANSVNRALLSMATTGKGTFDKLGIPVENAKGQFRDFGDVVLDLAAKTKDMTDTQRAKTLEDALGTFGMTSSLAIMQQLTDGVVTSTGEVLKNAEALAYLRQQMHNSKGTMADFKAASTQTWEGQKAMLVGVGKTMMVILGEPLAKTLGGYIVTITTTIRKVLLAFEALTPEAKKSFMNFALGAAFVFSAASALVGIQAIISLVVPLLLALKGSLLALGFGAILPLIPLLMVFYYHWDEAKLIIEAFIDILLSGRMSNAMERELQKMENKGVREFVIGLQERFNMVKTVIQDVFGTISEHRSELEFLVLTYGLLKTGMTAYTVGFAVLNAALNAYRSAALAGSAAQWMLNIAMSANPAGLVILAIAALIASLITYSTEWKYLWNNMASGIMDVFGGVWEFIKSGFQMVKDSLILLARLLPKTFQIGPVKALAEMETTSETRERVIQEGVRGPKRNYDKALAREVFEQDPMESLPMDVRSGTTAADAKQRDAAIANEQVIQDLLMQQAGIPIETSISLNVDGDKLAGIVHKRTKDGQDEMFMDDEYGYGGN